MKKLLLITMIFLVSCHFGRKDISEIRNCVILQQHCGWDNLDAGYYQVKDLTTGQVMRIDVDIRDCSVYSVGDTIK